MTSTTTTYSNSDQRREGGMECIRVHCGNRCECDIYKPKLRPAVRLGADRAHHHLHQVRPRLATSVFSG